MVQSDKQSLYRLRQDRTEHIQWPEPTLPENNLLTKSALSGKHTLVEQSLTMVAGLLHPLHQLNNYVDDSHWKLIVHDEQHRSPTSNTFFAVFLTFMYYYIYIFETLMLVDVHCHNLVRWEEDILFKPLGLFAWKKWIYFNLCFLSYFWQNDTYNPFMHLTEHTSTSSLNICRSKQPNLKT